MEVHPPSAFEDRYGGVWLESATSPRRTIQGPGRRRTAPGESSGPARPNYASTGNVIWQDIIQSQRGKGMLCGAGKKFYWSKLKEMVKFSLRKNWNSWQILPKQFL
ncbi:hypothetical protein Tco_0834972 [Tanacetum coccineum]